MLGIPSGDDVKALEAQLRGRKEPSKISTPLKVKLKANNNRKSRTNQKLVGLETIKEQDDMTKRIDEFNRIETADATDLKVVEKNIKTARTEDAQPVDSNRSGEQLLEHEVTKENNVS